MGRIQAKPGGVAGSVKFTWHGDVTSERLRKAIGRKLKKVGQHVQSSIKQNISTSSRIGRSVEGEMPHSETRRLSQSIFTHTEVNNRVQFTIIGTPLIYARWLEFGTRGQIRIVPTKARALAIRISRAEAMSIANRREYYLKGKKGKRLKRGNSMRARMKRAGIVRRRGKFWILRANVMRGPLRPRPFFRRTLNEQRRVINEIMTQPIKGLTTKVSGPDAPMGNILKPIPGGGGGPV